jgi:hypothetical protein
MDSPNCTLYMSYKFKLRIFLLLSWGNIFLFSFSFSFSRCCFNHRQDWSPCVLLCPGFQKKWVKYLSNQSIHAYKTRVSSIWIRGLVVWYVDVSGCKLISRCPIKLIKIIIKIWILPSAPQSGAELGGFYGGQNLYNNINY